MSRKQLHTPKGRIISSLRKLWLYSRERAAALKRAENRCECCGALSKTRKGGTVTLEVHHNNPIGKEWQLIAEKIYRHILVNPKHLTVFCKDCHEEEHNQ